MSSMEIILGEPSRLDRLASDIHDHYVAACANDPERVQKAMVVCSSRPIAFELLKKFQAKYPEWFVEKKVPDEMFATDEELSELKPMPFMAMVASVRSNDKPEMYNYLGSVKNDKRSDELDAAFKQEKSNFNIVIVVDMWITGFDVPALTYMYNDKPLKKHMLIQTISRVNRKYPGKDYGLIVDYIGIRENMRQANKVESVLESGEQEDIFSPEYFEKLSDVKMPASKLELLVKMLRKQITEYGKTNQVAAKKYQEMLEKTIQEYHERRKHLTVEEAGETQEQACEDIIRNATEQALQILREMNADRESFRKVGLSFEEKAFYDILMALREQNNFEYGEDKAVAGIVVNEKCKSLAKKIKEIIDTKSSFADWLNNQIVRDQLKFDIKVCLIKNGYPPQYSPDVFRKVMEQVENFEENN